jgi:hypothetical protein
VSKVEIDSGVRQPEPAFVEANRQAARQFDGRATGRARYVQPVPRGNKRHNPHANTFDERPMPVWLKAMGLTGPLPNATAPASDIGAFHAKWHEEQREKRAAARA